MSVTGVNRMDDTAILSSEGEYTSFSFGGRNIRFMTSPYLEKYVEVKEWDNKTGYIVVTARYTDCEEEEYIDLFPILKNLYIDPAEFLEPIKKVRVCYAAANIFEVVNEPDFYAGDYAFKTVGDYIRVLNTENLDRAAVMNKKGEVVETTMDDKELDIITEIYSKKMTDKG